MSTVGIFGLTEAEQEKFPYRVFNVPVVAYSGNMRDVIAIKHFLADVNEVLILTARTPSSLHLSLRGKKTVTLAGDLDVRDVVDHFAERHGFKSNGSEVGAKVDDAIVPESTQSADPATPVVTIEVAGDSVSTRDVSWVEGCCLAGSFSHQLRFNEDKLKEIVPTVLPMDGVARNGGRYQKMESAPPGSLFVTSMDYSDSPDPAKALRKAIYLTRYVMIEVSRKLGYAVEAYWFSAQKKVYYYITDIPYSDERTVLKSYLPEEMITRGQLGAGEQTKLAHARNPRGPNRRILDRINELAVEYGLVDQSGAKSEVVEDQPSVVKARNTSEHIDFWKSVYLSEFNRSGDTVKARDAATVAVNDLREYLDR